MANQVSDLPVRPGDLLAGKYRVERVLGQGGMGIVVLAMHEALEQRVAIKFLLPDAVRNPDAVARFVREARAATKIQSEHVVRVSDVGTLESGAPYMVMEYLDGVDLGQELEARGILGIGEAIDYVLQVTEALAEAHAAGIVHRDLKPANIFLTARADGAPFVKLLDFGISKVTVKGGAAQHALTRTTSLMGSPTYMSPEQMKSTRDVDARTDIWSLGIILHELIAGGPVFMADTMPQLCAMILGDPPPPLTTIRSDVPRGVEAVVLRCLEKDPAARFQNVGELALALAEFAPPHSRLAIERVVRVVRASGALVRDLPSMMRAQMASFQSVPPQALPYSSPPPPMVPPVRSPSTWGNGPMRAPMDMPMVGTAESLPGTMSAFGGTNGGVPRRRSARVAVLSVGMFAMVVGGVGAFAWKARERLQQVVAPMVIATAHAPASVNANASAPANASANAPANASANANANASANANATAGADADAGVTASVDAAASAKAKPARPSKQTPPKGNNPNLNDFGDRK